jgi:fatty acid desaturase
MNESKYNLLRSTLVSDNGVKVADFVKGLRPQYCVVYRDIALGYVSLVASAALIIVAPLIGIPPVLCGLAGGVLVGYCVAYLLLFRHEGAHYNLARKKATSDLLSDLLLAWLIGTGVKQYRAVHFPHHGQHGTVEDTEHTYFYPLNTMFIVKSLFGARALEVLLYQRRLSARRQTKAPAPSTSSTSLAFVAALVIHALIVAAGLTAGYWWFSLAWVLGMTVMMPFFGALRQLLEHRKPDVDDKADYMKVSHGAYTRLFGDGPFASTFGGAGFNRHLLHHWEPNVSYTNLVELERFLSGTEVREVIAERRTSYRAAFSRLFHFT